MSRRILHHSKYAISAGGLPIPLHQSLRAPAPGEGSNSELNRPILFIGGVHGDEPEGVELAMKFSEYLQKNNSPEIRSWILIPNLNPDGSRKNSRTNSRGVDLNRNFPSDNWSPEAKAPRYYPGDRPNSEPETQLVVSLIQQFNPLVIVHFHSWKPCVVYTGAPGKKWADLLAGETNYPVQEDIGYPTPGSLGEYGWGVCKIPVVCIEEQEGTPLSEVWPKFSIGLERVLKIR